jgi:hypothetical protein
MAIGVLRISLTKVVVDYGFRTDTDQDVTTEPPTSVPAPSTCPMRNPGLKVGQFAVYLTLTPSVFPLS